MSECYIVDDDDEEGEEVSDEEITAALVLMEDLEILEEWSFECWDCKCKAYPLVTSMTLEGEDAEICFNDDEDCIIISILEPNHKSCFGQKLCRRCSSKVNAQLKHFLKGE